MFDTLNILNGGDLQRDFFVVEMSYGLVVVWAGAEQGTSGDEFRLVPVVNGYGLRLEEGIFAGGDEICE